MVDHGPRNVLGLPIHAVDYEAAVKAIADAAIERRPFAVSALAVHGVMTGVLDPEHGHRLSKFSMLVPDGQPVRWSLRWLHGVALADRVYGPTLMLKTCEHAAAAGIPIFLFGSTEQTIEKLTENLIARFPKIQIAGSMPSQFRTLSQAEKLDVVKTIRDSGAQICFCGLGCPRQEVWAYEYQQELSMPILAVGAAYDFHAGTLKQAPEFLQRNGLEWAFRLVAEPRRLWRRYLYLNPAFLTYIAMQRIGLFRKDASNLPAPKKEIGYG